MVIDRFALAIVVPPTDQEFDFVSLWGTVEDTGSTVSCLGTGVHTHLLSKVTASWVYRSQSSQPQSSNVCDRAIRGAMGIMYCISLMQTACLKSCKKSEYMQPPAVPFLGSEAVAAVGCICESQARFSHLWPWEEMLIQWLDSYCSHPRSPYLNSQAEEHN